MPSIVELFLIWITTASRSLRAVVVTALFILIVLDAAAFPALDALSAADATPPATVPAATPDPSPTPTSHFSHFGLAFVNSAEVPSGPARIQRGVASGAQMDRFPLYWDRIEQSYGTFNWAAQDAALRANEEQGLNTLAVLLGTPGFYTATARSGTAVAAPMLGGSFVRWAGDVSAASTCQITDGPPPPSGLFNPIFADGSDLPAAGKAINPDNYWARFVHAAVQRYKPGGSAGLNVRHWEIWNEPDLCHFWSGTAREYARLLKVAYLVIKQSDPEAVVLWGGLAHFANGEFLGDLIDALRSDPLAVKYDGFFDAAASHHYSLAWNSYQYTAKIRALLDDAGWHHKPIWITESGVPVCNDYPGPPCPSPWRATPAEQAAYIWQNFAYTKLGGGGPIFHFMLHDDCGNEVRPDSPDGFGLVKNEASSFCSPSNAEPRLAYTTYQLMVQYLSDVELLWGDVQNGAVRRVAFYHPESKERRTLVWSIRADDVVGTLPATDAEARRLGIDGSEALLTPQDGTYTLTLPGATNRNWLDGNGNYDVGIYGAPYLLIERDTQPPAAAVAPLPAESAPEFDVTWQATDLGSGLASVALWMKENDGAWTLIADDLPASGSRTIHGRIGHRYRFTLLAADRAGNARTESAAQAETIVIDEVETAGRVIDPSGAPIPNVDVTIGAVTTTTDAAGNFTLTVPVGDWDIRVADQIVNRQRTFRSRAQLLLLHAVHPNVVTNGTFEEDLVGWVRSGSAPLVVEQQNGTGDHALRLAAAFVPNPGVPGEEDSNGGNSTISQEVTVPIGRPYLAFALRVESQEEEAGHDRFELILAEEGKEPVYLYVQEMGSDWGYRFFDLNSYAGRTVTLIFNVYQSSPNRPTSALIDLVTLSDTRAGAHTIYLPHTAK